MIKVSARQNGRAALLLRRISTGNDQVRPYAAWIAVLPFDRRYATLVQPVASGRPGSSSLDQFPNKRSMHLAHRPPASKSP